MISKGTGMSKLARKFIAGEGAASLIEYSILIGLITAVILAVIVAIGSWMGTQWQALNVNLT